MKRRCTDPRDRVWPYYGGRGITVCERWANSFEAFAQDMGPRPSKAHSIDRIDNNGNYEPGKCRWADQKIQNSNQRRSYGPRKPKPVLRRINGGTSGRTVLQMAVSLKTRLDALEARRVAALSAAHPEVIEALNQLNARRHAPEARKT
jgi:hypothetical protein